MLMRELAIDAEGEPFEVPTHITGWRVRRLQADGPGRPELVHDELGRPIVLPIDASFIDLRNAAGPGRYRLDPIDVSGRLDPTVKKASTGYVQPAEAANDDDAEASPPSKAGARANGDAMVEMARANMELAKIVVQEIPGILAAASSLITAADGASLTTRKPLPELPPPSPPPSPQPADEDDDDDEEDDDGDSDYDDYDDEHPPQQQPGWLNGLMNAIVPSLVPLIAKAVPDLLAKLQSGNLLGGLPLAALIDRNKAAPAGRAEPAAPAPVVPGSAPTARATPPAGGNQMAHLLIVFQELSSAEQMLARAFAAELSAAERAEWSAELSALSVPEAASRVRRALHAEAPSGRGPSPAAAAHADRASTTTSTATPRDVARRPEIAMSASLATTAPRAAPSFVMGAVAATPATVAAPMAASAEIATPVAPAAAARVCVSGDAPTPTETVSSASARPLADPPREADEGRAFVENHLTQIWNALSPEERASIDQLVARLTPEQQAAWVVELMKLSLPAALNYVRMLLENRKSAADRVAASGEGHGDEGGPETSGAA